MVNCTIRRHVLKGFYHGTSLGLRNSPSKIEIREVTIGLSMVEIRAEITPWLSTLK